MAQMGFIDFSDRYASLDAKRGPRVGINAVGRVPACAGAGRAQTGRGAHKSRAGRKPADAVLMVKTLVLSALYNLSDDQIKNQVRDRLSARTVFGPWSRGPSA